MRQEKTVAVIVAAGKGRRMGTKIPKQYYQVQKKPILYYTLHAFEQSKCIEEIILVVGKEDVSYCTREIIEKYQFHKVKAVIAGGKERSDSVYQAICFLEQQAIELDYVLIHDGVRPFVTNDILERMLQRVKQTKACIAGVAVKDTMKLCDDHQQIIQTLKRECVWAAQTPQAFSYALLKKSYLSWIQAGRPDVTDDATLVEQWGKNPVSVVEGSYQNIKITTPEDIKWMEWYLERGSACI